MLARHSAREIVLQVLFNLDFENQKFDKEKAESFFLYLLEDFYPKESEIDDFSKNLLYGVIDNIDKINEVISKAATDWPLEKIALSDRNILRIGIFEMLFNSSEPIPPRVAINEAIELAKDFGGKSSYKFISGVLGSIYDVMDIKEKDSPEEKKKKKVLKKEKLGALPFYIKDGKPMICMVHNIFGKWTLPKGSVEGDFENPKEALVDILKRKINMQGSVLEKIGENSYSAGTDDEYRIEKGIDYYLFELSNPEELKIMNNHKGLNNVACFSLEDFQKAPKYDDMKKIFISGLKEIKKYMENKEK